MVQRVPLPDVARALRRGSRPDGARDSDAARQPRDVFEIEPGKVHYHPGASTMARMLEDDTDRLRFDPTAAIPPLGDPNPSGLSMDRLRVAVDYILDAFGDFLRGAFSASEPDPIVEQYRGLRATYAVGVVFPDGPESWLRVDLSGSDPVFERTTGSARPCDAGHRIVASALAARLGAEKTYFYLRAFSRKWSTLLRAERNRWQSGRREEKEPWDLIAYYLERKMDRADMALKRWLDRQLEPFVGSEPEGTPSSLPTAFGSPV